MAKIRCPKCGYTEDDCRPHDRATYYEVCVKCATTVTHTADTKEQSK